MLKHTYERGLRRALGTAGAWAAGAMLLAACHPDEALAPGDPSAIAFASTTEAMTSRGAADAATRAGAAGGMDDEALQRTGFGVFAYHTDTQPWAAAKGSAAPNMMYNQQVAYTDGWVYSPVKYWPNDTSTGGVDDQDGHTGGNPAQGSRDGGRVSFFAYAPFVAVEQAHDTAADATPEDDLPLPEAQRTGIIALTGNGHQGTPQLTYRLDTDHARQVDLLWGTRGKATYQEASGAVNASSATQNCDLRKQRADERVDFAFKHALSCIDVYVQRIYDEVVPTGKAPQTEATRIFIGQMSLTGNVPLTGRFDFSDGTWSTVAGETPTEFTIGFGRLPADLRGSVEDNGELATVQAVELNDFDRKNGVNDTLKRLTETATTTLLLPRDKGVSITPSVTYSFVTRDDDLGDLGLPDDEGTHTYLRLQAAVTGDPVVMGTLKSGRSAASTDPEDYFIEQGKRYVLVCYIGAEHVSFRQVGIEDWDFPLRFRLESTETDDYTPHVEEKELNEE